MRSSKSFCTFSTDNRESSTEVDCPGAGELRGWVLAGCWSSLSARSRNRRMSESYGWESRSRLADREPWRLGEILSVLCLLGEGDRDDEEDLRWWGSCERDGGDDWRPREGRRDRRWWEGDRRCGDGEGPPASLLVMPAPEDQREGAGLLLYLRWGEGEWDELQRRGPGERDCQGRRGRVECCRPSNELLSSETSRRSHRERLAGGDIRRIGEEESGDDGGRLTLAREWSAEDFSRDPLWRRELLPARFEPVLCWARDASQSSEGLSCRSASGPMFSWETAGPTVDWGGALPTNCFQQFFMSSINSSFQPRTISGVGPWESVPASCGVSGRAAMFTLDGDAVGIKGGVAPGKMEVLLEGLKVLEGQEGLSEA